MANENLTNAKIAKNDEFYTQWQDIEKEMSAYLEYDPNVFKDKTILLPCDDPEWSNFTRFFAQNFERYGLKSLLVPVMRMKARGMILIMNLQNLKKTIRNIMFLKLKQMERYSL